MLTQLVKSLIKDKSVCILGFGREGKSTYNFFKKAGGFKSITVCDLNPVEVEEGVFSITGTDYQKSLDSFDIIMKSPGIVLEKGALKDFSKLHSQTELFLSAYRDRSIGVTGTKGKSTTSSLIHHVLKSSGKNAVLLGNIGIPPFDGEFDSDAIIVLELSSHQLEYTFVSPKVAVLLNLFPEHLDHYGTVRKYYGAKRNIYRFQKEDDLFICEGSIKHNAKSKNIRFGKNGDIIVKANSFTMDNTVITLSESCPLLGRHNVKNIAVAYAVTNNFGVTKEEFLKALPTFKPLPHRLEKVGEKGKITYFDDSISTCSETTIQALQTLKNVGTVLIGGMDRGIDYSPLINFLSSHPVPNVIFMYDTGKRIIKAFNAPVEGSVFHYAETLKEAVDLAKEVTPKNTICLLSPAAASYGFFKNFEDRGDKFKEYALS